MALWSKRRTALFAVFLSLVVIFTVSLLDVQDRLLTGNSRKTSHKSPDNFDEVLREFERQQGPPSEKRAERPKHRIGGDPTKSDDIDHGRQTDRGPNERLKKIDEIAKRDDHNGKDEKMGKQKMPNQEDSSQNVVQQSDDSQSSILGVIYKAAKNLKDADSIQSIGGVSNKTQPSTGCTACLFLADGSHVHNCITGEILGKTPTDFVAEPFELSLPPVPKPIDDATSFRQIYAGKKWGENDDGTSIAISGRGATIGFTQEVTAALHVVINQLKLILGKDRISLLDIPCGDMTWMSRFLETRDDLEYTGMDIVPEVIRKHQATFKRTPHKFINADVLKTGFNKTYDLILNRMMLQHLYNSDVAKFLTLASNGGSRFLMTTTFSEFEENTELSINDENPGRFRPLNLEVPPYSLGPPLCVLHDGPRNDFVRLHHYLALWELPLRRVAGCREPWAMYLKGYKQLLYSCAQWGQRSP